MGWSAFIMLTGAALGQASGDGDAGNSEWLTGRAFQKALEQPISATWDHVGLRAIARRIEATRHFAMLIDRRIDPSRELAASAEGEPTHDFLERLAAGSSGRVSVVGSTVYIGPPSAAEKLRTLIALRKGEFLGDAARVPQRRQFELTKAATFHWNDLDRPADLLKRLGEQYQLEIAGLDQVPHDLWAGATLPQADAADALSLVLIQFDLTFEWTEGAKGIRLVPVPDQVVIERSHQPPRDQTADAALARWKQAIPELEARIDKGQVVATGTVEQHELIERLKRPGGSEDGPGIKPKPLRLQRFSLRMQNKPASALLTLLEKPSYGLKFEYDAEALKKAGVNLDKLVTFTVKDATIEQLLKAALEPLGVAFEVDDHTVRLKTKGD